MSSTELASLRASAAEVAAWKEAAARLGLPFNRWARRALNDQVELDSALLCEQGPVSSGEGSSDGGCVG